MANSETAVTSSLLRYVHFNDSLAKQRHHCFGVWFYGYLIVWFLSKSAYKPIEHASFIEHLISWFICTQEIDENWYPAKNNESTLVKAFKLLQGYLNVIQKRKHKFNKLMNIAIHYMHMTRRRFVINKYKIEQLEKLIPWSSK